MSRQLEQWPMVGISGTCSSWSLLYFPERWNCRQREKKRRKIIWNRQPKPLISLLAVWNKESDSILIWRWRVLYSPVTQSGIRQLIQPPSLRQTQKKKEIVEATSTRNVSFASLDPNVQVNINCDWLTPSKCGMSLKLPLFGNGGSAPSSKKTRGCWLWREWNERNGGGAVV